MVTAETPKFPSNFLTDKEFDALSFPFVRQITVKTRGVFLQNKVTRGILTPNTRHLSPFLCLREDRQRKEKVFLWHGLFGADRYFPIEAVSLYRDASGFFNELYHLFTG